MKASLTLALLCVVFISLSACASSQTTDNQNRAVQPTVHPSRTFFGELSYTTENYQTAQGMRKLEQLLYNRFPKSLFDEDGNVPEKYLAAMYRDAAQGDRYITAQEFEQYKRLFLDNLAAGLPDPIQLLRRHRSVD